MPAPKGEVVVTAPQTNPPTLDSQIVTAAQLVSKFPRLREQVIDGLLRQGELMNVMAPPKSRKTWLVLHSQ